MAKQSWTVLDIANNEYLESPQPVELGSGDLKVVKSTLRGGLSDGVDVLTINSGQQQLRVLPTRGMGIWDLHVGEERVGWKSPVRGPVHPQFVAMSEPSGLGWLDGFDELLVRCGLESNGAPEFDAEGQLRYPLHGKIANRPAQQVTVEIDDESGQITVTGVVEETRFHFLKLRMTSTISVKRDETGFRLNDRIDNLSESDAETQMLYHVNFGVPLLDAGSQIVVPAKTVVPRNDRAAEGIQTWDSYEAAQPGFEEQVYFLELLADDAGNTRSLLKNAHGTQGVSMVFNKKQLPCFTVWKNTTAVNDGYVTGIEPGTNFPNPRSYEGQQGRVVQLKPLGSFSYDLSLLYHRTAQEVDEAEAAISALQGDTPPAIIEQPQPRWSPGDDWKPPAE